MRFLSFNRMQPASRAKTVGVVLALVALAAWETLRPKKKKKV